MPLTNTENKVLGQSSEHSFKVLSLTVWEASGSRSNQRCRAQACHQSLLVQHGWRHSRIFQGDESWSRSKGKGKEAGGPRREGIGSKEQDKMRARKRKWQKGQFLYLISKERCVDLRPPAFFRQLWVKKRAEKKTKNLYHRGLLTAAKRRWEKWKIINFLLCSKLFNNIF